VEILSQSISAVQRLAASRSRKLATAAARILINGRLQAAVRPTGSYQFLSSVRPTGSYRPATVAAAILACESGGCGCGRYFIRTKTARLRLDAAGCLNNTADHKMVQRIMESKMSACMGIPFSEMHCDGFSTL